MEVIKTKKGCLSILAGKSGMGKSTIAAFNAAEQIREGKSICFFSYEYCQSVIYNKLVAHFDLKWQELFGLDVVNARGLAIDNLKSYILGKKDEFDFVYIDYLDLVRETTFKEDKNSDDTNQKMEHNQQIVTALSLLAQELNVGIVLLVQEDAEATIENTVDKLNMVTANVMAPAAAYKMFLGRDEILNPMIKSNDISYVIIVDGYNLKHFSSINLKEAYKN